MPLSFAEKMKKTPTRRFSDRVANYVRYRPSYPAAVAEALIESCQLDDHSVVADIGAGTGIFTRRMLDYNLKVIAVEPNDKMRQAAEQELSHRLGFSSVSGTAEATNLPNDYVNLIVAAQAFHWFKQEECLPEFNRILKPSGRVALIWNKRKVQDSFQKAYDELLRSHAPEYTSVNHMNISDQEIENSFAYGTRKVMSFVNSQIFDQDGFLGRMQSSSYTPAPNEPEFPELMIAAKNLFSKFAIDGKITFQYDTYLHVGRPG